MKKYLPFEVEFLLENYALMKIEEIEKTILRSRKSIYKKAHELGLVKTQPSHKHLWTDEMIEKLKAEFPIRFTNELVKEMGISQRTIIRKARSLNLEKIENFKEINQDKINELISKNHAPNPMKGVKGFIIPNSEQHQFKKGERKYIPDYEKTHAKRNETIRRCKLRRKYGLSPITKMNLTNFY